MSKGEEERIFGSFSPSVCSSALWKRLLEQCYTERFDFQSMGARWPGRSEGDHTDQKTGVTALARSRVEKSALTVKGR